MHVMGADIGSTTTKTVALDMELRVVKYAVIDQGTGTNGIEDATSALYEDGALDRADCMFIMATGYGRNIYREADGMMSELSCHARGVNHLFPTVRTIIDIGGQDSKAIQINENGMLMQFTMNDKCAAGTGRFIETMCRVLKLDIAEIGNFGLGAEKVIPISNRCAVFAESEVVSSLSAGNRIEDIVAGINQSVAKKVASLAMKVGLNPDVCLTGGVAQNIGIAKSLEEELDCKVLIPDDPRITGALGAAIIGLEKYNRQA